MKPPSLFLKSPTRRHAQWGRISIFFTNRTMLLIGLHVDQSKRVWHLRFSSREGENMAAMAACFPKSPDPISRHRSQYKCSTPPWKEQYRKVIYALHAFDFVCVCVFLGDMNFSFDFQVSGLHEIDTLHHCWFHTMMHALFSWLHRNCAEIYVRKHI